MTKVGLLYFVRFLRNIYRRLHSMRGLIPSINVLLVILVRYVMVPTQQRATLTDFRHDRLIRSVSLVSVDRLLDL